MSKIQKKKTCVGRKKFELSAVQEAQFEKEFAKIYEERLDEFLRLYGDKSEGIYSRWFDEDMYRLREAKREEFIQKAKKMQRALEKDGQLKT